MLHLFLRLFLSRDARYGWRFAAHTNEAGVTYVAHTYRRAWRSVRGQLRAVAQHPVRDWCALRPSYVATAIEFDRAFAEWL